MKKVVSLVLIIGLVLCLCSCSSNDRFVGTWVCASWEPAFGDTEINAKLVLRSNGTGTYQQGETWAAFPATWEKVDDHTIVVYSNSGAGVTIGEEYCYEEVGGKPHLIFDNGVVSRDFTKQ